jgi:origin recognition complex subunit 3
VLSALKSTENILHIYSSIATRSDTALSNLPDTAVVFRRYLDSGKMINVYDWFESFAVAMRGENRGSLSAPRRNGNRAAGAPSSAGGSGATPGRAAQKRPKNSIEVQDEGDGGDDEADVVYGAEWRREIQARFLRSVHELEWMGLLKPTGRKKDHVLRTVYDPPSK